MELLGCVGSIFIARGVSFELLGRGGDTPWLKSQNKNAYMEL